MHEQYKKERNCPYVSFWRITNDHNNILRDVNDPDSIIKKVNTEEARELFREGVITGGMIPKVECCIEAIEKGVRRVTILDGRVPHAVLLELLTDEGAGTLVKGMD